MSDGGELYVLARCVLLDALEALGAHRHAVVLVGAQAVYLRVGGCPRRSGRDRCIQRGTRG